MKKMFVLLLAAAITATSWATPSKSPVSEKVLNAFASEFKNVTDARWASAEDFYIVTFTLNKETYKAWFTDEGGMEALQRNVTLAQMNVLSAKAAEELKQKGELVSIVEVNQKGELYYVVTTDDAKMVSTYKVQIDGTISKLSRKKK
ncbi:MAG: hypothetical protein K2X48_02940 [Chitinophagaceae bacterium]|nr:hypothetical protein [Chitinophagaceae bacterium]